MSSELHHKYSLEMDLFYMVLLSLLLMAGDVETNPGPYNKDICNRLAEDLQSLASEYATFGIYLNVKLCDIRCFEKTFKFDAKRIFLEIIDHWLNNTEESHRLGCLLNALDKVNRANLRENIRSNYKEKDFKDTAPSEHNDSAVADRSRIESNPEKSDNSINSDAIEPLDFMGVGINDERIKDLELRTIEIHGKFRKVLNTLFNFVKANSSAKEDLQWVLHQESPIKEILKLKHDHHNPIDFRSAGGIMRFLSQHSSFFNFELVESAINAIDFEEGKAMLGVYKKSFEVYAQNRVIECPTCLGKTSEADHCCCFVFLDENFKDYEQVYLKKLQHDISKIFGRDILHVYGVAPGSIAVIFHLPALLMDEIFPLSDENIHLLKNLIYGNSRIQKLICGFYSYTINSTTTVDNPSFASADLEKLEIEFFKYTDNTSNFDNDTEKAIMHPEIQHGSKIHWHASRGDLDSIRHLVKKGFYDPTKPNEHGNTALHCAARSGHLHLVKYFIEILSFNVYQRNGQDRSLLHLASISCCIQLVQYLLAMSCFDLYDKDMFNAVPLHYACGLGNSEIALILIEEMTKSIGLTEMLVQTSLYPTAEIYNPFHVAIGRGKIYIVHLFISKLKHNCSEDVFSLVLSVKHSHILQFLLHTQNFSLDAKHLALFMAVDTVCVDSINFLNGVHHCKLPKHVSMQMLPLFLAVRQGDLDKIKCIATAKKVHWNEITFHERSLLHHACLKGHLHIVKYLIEEQNVQILLDREKRSPLHLACISSDVELIRYLLKRKVDPLLKDSSQNTPLHFASANGGLDAVKFLLDTNTINPSLKGASGRTPLHFTCHEGHLSIVQYLIENWKCDPLCSDDFSCTPLGFAVSSGHLKIVKYLTKDWSSIPLETDGNKDNIVQIAVSYDRIEVLRYFLEEKGCDYSMKDNKYEMSLLHVSSISGSLRVMKYLVEVFHMDPKSRDNRGLTSLHFASLRGHLETVIFLKDFFHPYEEIQDKKGNTPLSLAALKGHAEVVQFLIENGVYDSDSKLPDNDSYLHVIALSGNFVALKLLLRTGKFNVHCQNKYERTPLMIACMHGHLKLAKYFIETHHCDPVAADKYKNTSLHQSALTNIDLVKYLIEELCLDPNIKGYLNKEPLHMASQNGKLDIVEYLVLKHKCDPSVKADKSVCPLHYAACGGHLPVLKFLISQGCSPFTRNDGNSTPFHLAALCGKLDIIKYYVEEMSLLNDLQQYFNSAISMATQNQHLEVVSYLESQLPVASAKDTNPVAYTDDEIKKMMLPFVDESRNKQEYKERKHFYNIPQKKTRHLKYSSILQSTWNVGLHFIRRFM